MSTDGINESTDSPHGDADATDATLILADRLHQIIRDAGHDCPEDEAGDGRD